MAVEARHLNFFPSQLVGNREMINPIETNTSIYNDHQMGYTVPLSITNITTDTLLPAYNSLITDLIPLKAAAMKSDSSSLTYNYNLPVQRKRSRSDSINPFFLYPTHQTQKNCGSFSFLGEDISLEIQQQEFDIERLITQHMENVSMELEEKRKRQARRIIEAIEVGMIKRLRTKEEEIEKIVKLNWALEEKVKSLCIENQIWRDLAQSNEATANALRTNLHQVLAQVKDERTLEEATALTDDAQSYCGSSGENDDEDEDEYEKDTRLQRTLAGCAREMGSGFGVKDKTKSECTKRLCRNCGKKESCVLLLPCRHLCLCTPCGSTLHTCPVCKSTKNASVHVNMS